MLRGHQLDDLVCGASYVFFCQYLPTLQTFAGVFAEKKIMFEIGRLLSVPVLLVPKNGSPYASPGTGNPTPTKIGYLESLSLLSKNSVQKE